MEVELRTQVMAKKLWGIVRVVLYMLRKGLSKTKLWFDLNMLLKRSTKIAGKAIGNLLLDHHSLSSTLTCRPNDIHATFISPREYEFSCSNSPVFYHRRKHNPVFYRGSQRDHEVNVKNIKRVFDILNSYDDTVEVVEPEKSPLAFWGFEENPLVRQLRVTDSPFPANNTEEEEEDNLQVDKAAEEFIKNFYKELKQQKRRAAVDSPSPYHKWGQFR